MHVTSILHYLNVCFLNASVMSDYTNHICYQIPFVCYHSLLGQINDNRGEYVENMYSIFLCHYVIHNYKNFLRICNTKSETVIML